jgi:hypothetical protein
VSDHDQNQQAQRDEAAFARHMRSHHNLEPGDPHDPVIAGATTPPPEQRPAESPEMESFLNAQAEAYVA